MILYEFDNNFILFVIYMIDSKTNSNHFFKHFIPKEVTKCKRIWKKNVKNTIKASE